MLAQHRVAASAVVALSITIGANAHAQVGPGRAFVAAGAAVWELNSEPPAPHATGLSGAQDVCVGPNDELYVSEAASGEITIVSAGGDVSAALPFASGLSEPRGLWCDAARVLVADRGANAIVDVSAGGDAALAPILATVSLPTALLEDGDGDLWVVSDGAAILRAGTAAPHATYAGVIGGLALHDGKLLAALLDGDVVDFAPGGDLASAEVVASGSAPSGLLSFGAALWASSANGTVTDLIGDTVIASAIGAIGDGGMAYSHVCGDGIVAPNEACDDGVFSLQCRDDCTPVICGDGIVEHGFEDCDDGNTVDGDGCSSGCTLQFKLPPRADEEEAGACGCRLAGAPSPAPWWIAALFVALGARDVSPSARESRRRRR